MIFRVFKKKELRRIFDLLAAKQPVVGPVRRGKRPDGTPLFDFAPVSDFDALALDYSQTVHSAKRFVLPPRETLATFAVEGADWSLKPENEQIHTPVLFGLHACDINALNKLDLVLARNRYPSADYIDKRERLFIIGIDCTPQPECFCRSMGTDSAIHGFALFLTDLGESYFAEILSAKAFELLGHITCKEPGGTDHRRYKELAAKKAGSFATEVETSDLTKILDLEFDSPAWQHWGDKCLSCGTCAGVCPTCYCYGVEERVNLDLAGAVKIRSLHSCNLVDFATVAGGHNFRPTSASRLKYRYYHKHRGFVEAFEESLCVGCGRCGAACLANIAPPAVIASVRSSRG